MQKLQNINNAAVIYSGGKDSHLTLYKALKKGYKVPFLITFNGGKNHFRIFNDCLKLKIIHKHAKMIGADLLVCDIKGEKFKWQEVANVFINISRFAISNNYRISEIFSSFDLHGVKENTSLLDKIVFLSSLINVNMNFSHASKDVIAVLKECKALNIVPVIVSTEKKINPIYLGKPADANFIKYMEKEKRRGNFISGNDFQTLVVRSPLFDRKMEIIDAEIFSNEKTNFLNIKKYEFK